MKKFLTVILLSSIAWVLFYEEQPGLNVLFAQILSSVVVLFSHYRRLNAVALSLWGLTWVSALLVCYWGGFGTALLCFGLWVLILIQLHYPQASLLFSSFHGLLTALSFPLFFYENKNTSSKKVSGPLLLSILVSIIILIVFLIYYRSTNELFDRMVAQIPLPEISVPAIRFWILSALLLLGLSTPRLVSFFQEAEDQWKPLKNEGAMQSYILIAAWILFSGLNLLIVGMNITDIYYLFFSAIPKEISYSEFLHQSVNASIVSILMAIGLIVWMERQGSSADKSFVGLRILLYLWIIQNIVLAFLSVEKNMLYVTEYGLTHKRIGVFAYLLACAAGLMLTAWMCFRKLNLWFLLRSNAWALLLLLIACQTFSWDYTIARFNLDYAHTKDRQYLVELGKDALPVVLNDALKNPDLYNTPQRFQLLQKAELQLSDAPEFLEQHVHAVEIQAQCKRFADLTKAELSLQQ